MTASWANIQPWQVIITEGEATRRFAHDLYAHAQKDPMGLDFDFPPPPAYRGVYDERRKECGIQLYTSLGIQRGDRQAGFLQALENFRLFGAPHAAIITTDRETGLYGAVDTGGYLANFMLAAQSLGIATIPQASLARYGSFVRSHFNLPQERAILCGLSFGYADVDHAANGFRTFRADPREVVEFHDR
jgi:nitroreductase